MRLIMKGTTIKDAAIDPVPNFTKEHNTNKLSQAK